MALHDNLRTTIATGMHAGRRAGDGRCRDRNSQLLQEVRTSYAGAAALVPHELKPAERFCAFQEFLSIHQRGVHVAIP